MKKKIFTVYRLVICLITLLLVFNCSLDEGIDTKGVNTQVFVRSNFAAIKADWNFEGSTLDISGNNNHGTLMNGASYSDGIVGRGLQLDGVNDYMRVNNYSAFNNMSTFTISAWIYPTVYRTHNSIISKVNPNRDFVLKLTSTGKLEVHFAHGNTYYNCTSTQTIPLNKWSHVAASWTGSSWILYYNGSIIATRNYAGKKPLWTGTIMGVGTMNWSEVFTGKIDSVKVFGTALTNQEMSQLYIDTPRAIGIWQFNGNTSDESGMNNHGTLTNGATYSTGIVGQALLLDGVNDYMSVTNYSAFNNMSTFTISAWVYPTALHSSNPIISKVNPNRDFVLKLTNTGNLNVHFAHDSTYYHCTSSQTIPLNRWSYVAASWTGTSWILYINGISVITRNCAGKKPLWTGTKMGVGTMNWSEVFTGKIERTKVYGKSLTDAQVKDEYNATKI